ncbi:MAG TPA: metalloregulator ArsR/SmtB family transcription factor [Tepidisphaeraceae bacterium]|jgi:DNA-binding transcriptional ArsR family regulator|nr:metalloregulator ArsR/SmtB family transcription factor [Tepidisphaeraceae bacterium]
MVKRDQGVSEQDLDQLSSLFRLLSDKTRLSILMRLSDGERNVTTLCEELALPQPTVSHHLGLLRMNNVVGNRRHGKQVFYALHGSSEFGNGTVMEFGLQNLMVQVKPKSK